MSNFLYKANCPHHPDDVASMGVYDDGHVHCFGCGHHEVGGVVPPPPTWFKKRSDKPVNRYDGPLPWSMVDAYVEVLNGPMASRKDWLYGRGLRNSTIEKLRLGHTGSAFTIPVWSYGGSLETVKYRADPKLSDEGAPKYKCLPGSKVTIYGGWQVFTNKTVFLCEGELDAARLIQEFWLHSIENVAAVSFTGGCNSVSEEGADQLIQADRVLVIYDQDEAGQKAGDGKHCYMGNHYHLAGKRRSQAGKSHWPQEWGKDVTEAINNVGFEVWFRTVLDASRA